MKNSSIEPLAFMNPALAEPAPALRIPDHDIPELAIGFGRQPNRLLNREVNDFHSTTVGSVTFRRVDPLREPLKVADIRLQRHLEDLCETLRAKY
jgi:hypothetical protein